MLVHGQKILWLKIERQLEPKESNYNTRHRDSGELQKQEMHSMIEKANCRGPRVKKSAMTLKAVPQESSKRSYLKKVIVLSLLAYFLPFSNTYYSNTYYIVILKATDISKIGTSSSLF